MGSRQDVIGTRVRSECVSRVDVLTSRAVVLKSHAVGCSNLFPKKKYSSVLEPPDRAVYSPDAARQFVGPFATDCNAPPVLSRCISMVHGRFTMKALSKVSALISNS